MNPTPTKKSIIATTKIVVEYLSQNFCEGVILALLHLASVSIKSIGFIMIIYLIDVLIVQLPSYP